MLEVVKFALKHATPAAGLEKLCFSEPWTETQLRDSAASELYRMFAAELDGEFAGYCGFQYIPDEGYITNVAVCPQFRRMGVGDLLIEKMCACGDALGLQFLTLEVRTGNMAAQKLYEKHGFAPVGSRRNFYVRPNEDAVLMTKYYVR